MPNVSLTKWEIVKITTPSILTMVILPLVDVISDITLVSNLYINGHWHFATILLGQYSCHNKIIMKINKYNNTNFSARPIKLHKLVLYLVSARKD